MADFIDLSPALQGVVWKLLGLNEPRWGLAEMGDY